MKQKQITNRENRNQQRECLNNSHGAKYCVFSVAALCFDAMRVVGRWDLNVRSQI